MMVNCPKCGFSQPEDQYCASCGVNMVAYKAKARASRSIFMNPAVQIGGLAVVVIAAFVFVRSSNKARLEKIAADTPIVREADQQENELAQAQAEQSAARQAMNETSNASVASQAAAPAVAAPSEAAATAPAADAQAATVAAPVVAGSKAVPPAAGIRAALAAPKNVRVYFIEANRAFLSELMSEAREPANDGNASYGVVANLDERLKSSRDWHPLDKTDDQTMKMNQPNMIVRGTRDQSSGQNIGLTVQVIPLSADETGVHLQVDANRTLREPASGIDSYNFQMPESFSVPKGSSIVMTGVLPHRPVGNEEQAIYRNVNVLKPMAGEGFRSGATDVAIIIQAH